MRHAGGPCDQTKSHPHSRHHNRSRRAGAVGRTCPRRSQSRDRLCRQPPLFGNLRVRPATGADLFGNHGRDARCQSHYLGHGLQGRSRAAGRHGDIVRLRQEPRGLSRGFWLLSRSWRCGRRCLAACRRDQPIAGAVAGHRRRFRGCTGESATGDGARSRLRRARTASSAPHQGGGGRERRPCRRRALCRGLRHRYPDPRFLRDQVRHVSADGHSGTQRRAYARQTRADRGMAAGR